MSNLNNLGFTLMGAGTAALFLGKAGWGIMGAILVGIGFLLFLVSIKVEETK